MAEIESQEFWSDAKEVNVNDENYWQDATVMDAPPNSVFDHDNGRVVSVPQTLNASETEFVIKRDADKVENFFGMEDVGNIEALGKGVQAFAVSQPQAAGGLLQEFAELSIEARDKPEFQRGVEAVERAKETPVIGGLFKFAESAGIQLREKFGTSEEILEKSKGIIERNKKYMADAGLVRPEEGGVAGFMFDLGQGGGSLLASLGIAGLTRSPKTAGVYFGALQKSSVYQEAREIDPKTGEPKKTPTQASEISTLAGVTEAALEFVGLDYFMKALKGNTAVRRFITGGIIEGTQEGLQAAGEEAITQISGVRDKKASDTIKDILYSAVLGSIIGGGTNATLGAFAQGEAKKRGLDKGTAKSLGKYVEGNVDKASENLTEFIDKEVAPIAGDEKSAQEFISLMQKFGNDIDLVQRDSLDTQTRATFDQYVDMFNQSTSDKVGVEAVEKQFFEQLTKAGVSKEQAVGASKLVAARSDAASRALGVTPLEFLESKNISVQVTKKKKIPKSSPLFTEAKKIKEVLSGKAPLNQEVSLDEGIRLLGTLGFKKEMTEEQIAEKLSEREVSSDRVFQAKKAKKPQGQVTFGEDAILIELFETSNASTLLHELGHIFLRDIRDVAKATKRPKVKQDYEIVKKWLGATSDMLTIAQEEKFARGFEAFLREGKAPKPELQGVFTQFKEWLTAIYSSVKKLNVNINPEIRRVFDRMLGADFVLTEQLQQEEREQSVEEDYVTNRLVSKDVQKRALRDDTAGVFRSIRDWGSDSFIPVSTRLGNIDKGIKSAVRRFVFNVGLQGHQGNLKVKPFIEKVSDTFSEDDYIDFDLALKNRDVTKVDELVDQYGIREEWNVVRETLDGIFNEALDVGLDINYIEEYFPRKVKHGKAAEFMAFIRGEEVWSEIETAMREADPKGKFNHDEQAAFVNSYLRGFRSASLNLSAPSFTKDRTIDYITPDFNQFYQDSMPTLIEYIGALRHSIESRKLFGKSSKDADENIGSYVLDLVEDGVIDAKDELALKKILKAVVEPQGTHGFVSWMKNSTYIYVMGNPISAITQIGDLAFSLHINGYYRTVKSLTKSLTGRQVLKREDIGIDNILQEFEDETRASNLVRKVFKLVGLEFMDNVGKETFIDASLSRLTKAAKKGGKDFNKEMTDIFGDQAKEVTKDLLDGNITENVKFLLFSELSDVQPISLAEMPVNYLQEGNWRVMYMLKTYTMKQMDIYRREIFDNLASGDAKLVARGMKNMISLAASLMVMGMSSDALKDLLLGREITIDDLVIDNLLKLMGISKYQIYKSKAEGIGNAIFRYVTPPLLSPLDDLRDIGKIATGKKDVTEADILQRVPLVGKFYHWWWGGGKARTLKKRKKTGVSTL